MLGRRCSKNISCFKELSDEFENVIIYLGDFPLFQENFAIMGQFVSGCVLENIVYQSGLSASGSLKGVLRGRRYNRLGLYPRFTQNYRFGSATPEY